MRIIDYIDIDIAITVLRVLAAVLTGAALLCVARVGPRLLAACLSTGLAFIVLGINSHWLKHLDTSVELWVRPHRSPDALAGWSEIWNYIGDPIYFAGAVLACGAWFSWRARSAIPAAVMVAAVGVGVVLEQTLKEAVGRSSDPVSALHDRPGRATLISYLHSFPSGHVTVIGAFVGTAAVCLCAGRHLATKVKIGVLAATGVAFIGLLAVYIRAHTFTDVVGGTVLSAAIVAIAGPTLAASAVRVRRLQARPHTVPARAAAPLVRRDRVAVG